MKKRYKPLKGKDKCLCEDCDSKKILQHFERCPKCFSEAYHYTPKYLNYEVCFEDKEVKK